MTNRISAKQRVQILSLTCEGMGTRAIGRITGANKGTVARTVREAGIACRWLHGVYVRGMTAPIIECDELWSFVGARDRRLASVESGVKGVRWTWLAFDPSSKLALHWHIGLRDEASADLFFFGLSERLAGTCEIRADANRSYAAALGGYDAFDHPAITSRAQTNGVERLNMTIRAGLRRYARRSQGYSKSPTAMEESLSLFLFYYNFVRSHASLGGGVPARKAGLIRKPWTMAEIEQATTAVWSIRPRGVVWDRVVARLSCAAPSVSTRPVLVASGSSGELPCGEDHTRDAKRRKVA